MTPKISDCRNYSAIIFDHFFAVCTSPDLKIDRNCLPFQTFLKNANGSNVVVVVVVVDVVVIVADHTQNI